MILLLDAHALLWWLADDPTLSRSAHAAIRDPMNDVLVSAGSIWEIEIKRAVGKLASPAGLLTAIEEADFETLPITGADAQRAALLPTHHRDPFDRMLVAQAKRLDAIIVSRGEQFAPYEVNVLAA